MGKTISRTEINGRRADTHRKQLIAELKSLEELEGVRVTVSGRQRYTVTVAHDKMCSLDFKLIWTGGDHFVARTIPGGAETPPVLALWTRFDVLQFVTAYVLLIGLRARRQPRSRLTLI